MADGKGNGRVTLSGLAFAALLLVLIIVSLWLFIGKPWWFPEVISGQGRQIDSIFGAVLLVTGIAFVIVQGLLGYFVARYGASGNERASYWHDHPTAEIVLLVGTAVILTVLVFMGQKAWRDIFFSDRPKDPIEVHVTAHQFAWEFHYPGPDGKFGRTDPKFIDAANNPIGQDEDDPDGKDDVRTTNQLHVPANKPIIIQLQSQDVIHSFFLPNARVKQDAVPGLSIEISFVLDKAGKFEIACAELCGANHYAMRGFLTVEPTEDAYKNWVHEEWTSSH